MSLDRIVDQHLCGIPQLRLEISKGLSADRVSGRRDLSTEAWDAPKSEAGRWASAIKEIYLQEGSVK